MNRYRMALECGFLRETLEYYFLAKNDKTAKKYLALKVQEILEQEQQELEQMYVAYDGRQIVSIHKGEIFLAGRIFCLPNKFPELNEREVNQQTTEEILKKMKRYCKSVKMGIPSTQDRGRKKKQGVRQG